MTDRLHVLMVTSERGWRGGEAQVCLLMRGLLEEGCNVTLACAPHSEIAKRSERLPGLTLAPLAIAGSMDLVSAWRARSMIRKGDYDLVHCHNSHAHSVVHLAVGGAARRPRVVVSRRVSFRAGRNAFSARKYRHGADLFIAISRAVRDGLLAQGVDEGRVTLIPSGLDFDRFEKLRPAPDVRASLGVPARARLIGTVGALSEEKAQDQLVLALPHILRQIPNTHLVLVGEGDRRRNLEGLVTELNLTGHCTLTGHRNDALDILGAMECFVMCSKQEGLGTSIMDAQVLGVPVVATRVGGIPDLVEDGVTGRLVDPGDAEGLGRSVIEMLEDKSLSDKVVGEAREQAKGYHYRHMVYKTLNAYRSLLEPNPL